jgi:hypothetical protein
MRLLVALLVWFLRAVLTSRSSLALLRHNRARPSQALHAIPALHLELSKPLPKTGKLIALPVLGGVRHDFRLAA